MHITHSSQRKKNIKALLVRNTIDFPYTHNLLRLTELDSFETVPDQIREAAIRLTPFAVTLRYPGEDDIVTKEEAEKAIELAEEIRHFIFGVMEKDDDLTNV